jgi:hypothetical protein
MMKPVPISEYLNRMGEAREEGREGSRRGPMLFRPLPPSAKKPEIVAPSTLSTLPIQRKEPPAGCALSAVETVPPSAIAEKRLNDAYERGRQDALAWARTEHERALEEERTALQERLQSDQREFRRNELATLAQTLCASVEVVERSISETLVRILNAFFEGRVARQAIEEICEKVAKLGSGSSPLRLKIRGPEAYFDLCRSRLAPLGAEIEFTAQAVAELTIETRETVFETQLQAWAAALATLEA